jgi:hypothetical protein
MSELKSCHTAGQTADFWYLLTMSRHAGRRELVSAMETVSWFIVKEDSGAGGRDSGSRPARKWIKGSA